MANTEVGRIDLQMSVNEAKTAILNNKTALGIEFRDLPESKQFW